MRHFYILLLLILILPPAFSQTSYYATDSSMYVGVKTVDGGKKSNSRYCQIKKGNEIIKFSPYEVSGYGLKNGKEFKSFSIVLDSIPNKYFLEILSSKEVNLFYLHLGGGIHNYYVNSKGDSNLIELPQIKDQAISVISDYTSDCINSKGNLQYVRFKKASLKRYFDDYNTCSSKPFPRLRFGIKLGLRSTGFSPVDKNSTYSAQKLKNDWGLSFGLFSDIPINSSNLSLSPEIVFSRNHVLNSFQYLNNDFDLLMNFSSLDFPVSIRYSFLKEKITPFIQGGFIYSTTIKNSTTLYSYNIETNNVFVNTENDLVINKHMGGFLISGGMTLHYSARYSFFYDVRYSKLYNWGQSTKLLNIGNFTLFVGLIF